MFRITLTKEWRMMFRHTALYILSAIYFILLILAFFNGYYSLVDSKLQRQEAATSFRRAWNDLEANPHAAAHVGTYLFKSLHPLQLLDPGITSYTGVSYRVEAHKQHEANYATATDSDIYLRFGELSVAFLLQLLLPLFVLLLAHNMLGQERTYGTLKLLLIQNAKPFMVVLAKVTALYGIVLLWLIPAFVGGLAFLLAEQGQMEWGRFLFFIMSYLSFFALLCLVFTLFSAWCKRGVDALLLGLLAWMLLAVVMPRGIAGIADEAYPFPSRYQFNKWVEEGFFKGLEGDKNSRARKKDLLTATLKKYRVDSVTQLPFNFEGLAMQDAEEYNSKVYRKYASGLERQLFRQERLFQKAAFINPFMAIQQISMRLAGSDLRHHLLFLHQAQLYRDDFMRRLNGELAAHGDKNKPYQYVARPAFYKGIPSFQYKGPTLTEELKAVYQPLLSLFGWCLLAMLLLFFTAKKLVNQ